jgi:hypothetical protein
MPLNKAITYAVYCTIFLEALGFWLCASVLALDYRLFAVSLAPGWIPIVVVAMRRPDRATRLDMVLMCSGFPIVLGTFMLVARLLL